jgi:hypothetical protein
MGTLLDIKIYMPYYNGSCSFSCLRQTSVSRKAARSQRADYQYGNYLSYILQVFIGGKNYISINPALRYAYTGLKHFAPMELYTSL